jgi:hypothetical protein
MSIVCTRPQLPSVKRGAYSGLRAASEVACRGLDCIDSTPDRHSLAAVVLRALYLLSSAQLSILLATPSHVVTLHCWM